jgi:hypothetical protein
VFVVYDNIKYTKKGWINRNRMLQNGRDVVFSLPLKGDSDFLEVRDRELAADFDRDRMLNQIRGAYGRAPHFAQTFPLVEEIVRHDERNLFRFLHNSIVRTCEHLGIATKIRISSDIAIDHGLKGQERVLALCDALGASTYLNAIGGTELYGKDEFRARGVELKFIKPKPFEYAQFGGAFVAWLSIVDVMMFNSPDTVRERIRSNYDLV